MWYDINSREFDLSAPLPEEVPESLQLLPNGKYKVQCSSESFDLNDLSPILKLATKKSKFTVILSDNKGSTSYDVKFGLGMCEEV